jgi:glycosyltransferase involved in cell wall biosynthesis
MKALLLNTFQDWGGAAKAAYRLNRGLQGIGVDARLLVQARSSEAADVMGSRGIAAKIEYALRAQLDTLPVRRYANKPIYNFTPALVPDRVARPVASFSPDIVHLHWTAVGFLRIETLQSFRQPLVWTLHDSWAFTGGCHIPYRCLKYRDSCGACPVLGSQREDDLSRKTWRRKQAAWRDLEIALVTPSRWLADCARSSSLFGDRPVRVIPNGLDTELFAPSDRLAARKLLGLSPDKRYLLFGAMSSTSDPNKGFDLLLPALQRVAAAGWAQDAELLVFGASQPAEPPSFGMKARYLGRVADDAGMARLYCAADLLVAPSRLENLPNTVMESMACGTPCVAFNQGGMADLIDHGETGYLASPYESQDLARGIGFMLENGERRLEMGARSRLKVEREFALEKVARRYAELYRELVQP